MKPLEVVAGTDEEAECRTEGRSGGHSARRAIGSDLNTATIGDKRVARIMGDELVSVAQASKIYLRGSGECGRTWLWPQVLVGARILIGASEAWADYAIGREGMIMKLSCPFSEPSVINPKKQMHPKRELGAGFRVR